MYDDDDNFIFSTRYELDPGVATFKFLSDTF